MVDGGLRCRPPLTVFVRSRDFVATSADEIPASNSHMEKSGMLLPPGSILRFHPFLKGLL